MSARYDGDLVTCGSGMGLNPGICRDQLIAACSCRTLFSIVAGERGRAVPRMGCLTSHSLNLAIQRSSIAWHRRDKNLTRQRF